MKNIRVSICTGTACFVMGASEIMMLEDSIPEDLQGRMNLEIEGVSCLGKCTNHNRQKAPFVLINDNLLENATLAGVIDALRTIVEEEE